MTLSSNQSKTQFISQLRYFILGIISLMIYPLFLNIHSVIYSSKSGIDDFIPFWPVFVIPYILYIPYLIFTVFIFPFVSQNFKRFTRVLVGIELFSGLIYYFFQTFMQRPDLTSGDIFTTLVSLIYNIDQPYNCFPSTHVSLTIFCTYFWLKEDWFRLQFRKMALIIFASLIIVSTVFVKQHYILDVLGGATLAFGVIWGVGKLKLI
jgi:membrane-associated phospholipid phosphatase